MKQRFSLLPKYVAKRLTPSVLDMPAWRVEEHMKVRHAVILSTAFVLFWDHSAVGAPQSSAEGNRKTSDVDSSHPQNDDEKYKFSVRSNLVLLPTRVQRKNGETIYGLKQEQFIVEDNGEPQQVHLEEDPEVTGLSLVVAVQCSRFGEAELEKFKGLATMIEGIVGEAPHEVAVVSYGEGPYLLGDFSSRDDDTRFALSRLQRCGDFHAVTIDTVNYAIHLLKRRQNRYRRAILLISETRDHGSHSKLNQVIAELGVSDTVIYSVAFSPVRDELLGLLRNGMEGRQTPPPAPSPFPTGPPRASPTPTPTPAPAPTPNTPEPIYLDHAPALSPDPKILLIANALRHSTASELASLSGGEYINFTTPKGFEKALQRVANHVHDYYLLSFKPGPSPALGLHSLQVSVPDYPDAIIQTRRSYWSGILEEQTPEGK
jgi:VWFA-related protein